MGWGKNLPGTDVGVQQLHEAVRKGMILEGYTMGSLQEPGGEMSGPNLLDLLNMDLVNDICGDAPLSSLNYVWVLAQFMMLFLQIEEELGKLRNRLYVQAYETDPKWRTHKRVVLVCLALQQEDDECLRVMAREFESHRAVFMSHIYWEDLESMTLQGGHPRWLKKDEGPSDQCAVM